MKALVMGGTEFVSSSLVKYLISRGYEVDIFTRGIKPVQYDGIRRHLKGDRKSAKDLKKNILDECYEYVFDVSAYTKEDVESLTAVIDRRALKRYVLCSSGSVYVPSTEKVAERFERGQNPNWGEYGLNKKKAEDYLFRLYHTENFPVTIIRPVYIYGRGNNLYREIYLFDRITRGLAIPIPAGDAATQFVYITDLVKVFEDVVHNERAIGQAYNITHPEEVTWRKLVETAMQAAGKKVSMKEVNSIDVEIAAREFFPFRNVTYLVDTEKAKMDGIYEPQINLLDGMKLAYSWYCTHSPELKDPRMNKVDIVLS